MPINFSKEPNIFKNMNLSQPAAVNQKAEEKNDTVEIAKAKEKDPKLDDNKKLIAAVVAGTVAIVGAFFARKNIAKLFKKGVGEVSESAGNIVGKNLHEEMIKNAREFLIDDVKKIGTATANGICFYGPDSIGKEKALEGFITDLSKADYKIVRIPRANEASIKEIKLTISRAIKEAEETFKTTNQRTAIIVRDLETIAQDRNIDPVNNAVAPLLKTEKCSDRGFVWISETKEFDVVDIALRRAGRMDHKMPIKPTSEDPKEVWDAYIELVQKYAPKRVKQWFLDDAINSMPK